MYDILRDFIWAYMMPSKSLDKTHSHSLSFQGLCSVLAFLLYYFGLSVFFWQFLKAAQLSGKFDDFFAKGRNIYFFYFMLGWSKCVLDCSLSKGR